LFTLDPARVLHRIGALTASDLAEVDRRLRRALEM
jgi:mRNA-degrading endonuclease toxin of MazEF toxin-antitoxin module